MPARPPGQSPWLLHRVTISECSSSEQVAIGTDSIMMVKGHAEHVD